MNDTEWHDYGFTWLPRRDAITGRLVWPRVERRWNPNTNGWADMSGWSGYDGGWEYRVAASPQAAQPSFDRDKIFRDAEFRAAAYSLMQLVEGPGCKRWEDGNGFRLKDTNEWCRFYVAVKNVQNFAAAPPSQPAVELEQFRPAVECWKSVITTMALNLPFDLQAHRGMGDYRKADRLLALIDGAKAGKGEVK